MLSNGNFGVKQDKRDSGVVEKKRMEQSSSWSVFWTPRESEVAEILVKLETLILELEGVCGFPFTWGLKKKRSAIASESESPSPPPPPPPKAEASSPATPLSFSPSESDDNPTLTRRNVSLKRKREHYLKNIDELTKANDLLYGEINNVKSYFDRLKDFNFKLKARKQELRVGPNQDDIVHKQQQPKFPGVPLIANQTTAPPRISDGEGVAKACGKATTSLGVPSSSGRALGVADTSSYDVGPTGIPDLNVPLEEPVGVDCCEALDVNVVMANTNRNLSRAMAAQARKNRLQICRVKNPIGNTKTRYSCR